MNVIWKEILLKERWHSKDTVKEEWKDTEIFKSADWNAEILKDCQCQCEWDRDAAEWADVWEVKEGRRVD